MAKPPGEEGTSPDIQVVMSLPVLGNVSDIVVRRKDYTLKLEFFGIIFVFCVFLGCD